jgi:hypothetical protein
MDRTQTMKNGMRGWQDEFKIGTDTDTFNPGGDIHRSKCHRGRDRISILESFIVECAADIFHLDIGIHIRMVLAWLSLVSQIKK